MARRYQSYWTCDLVSYVDKYFSLKFSSVREQRRGFNALRYPGITSKVSLRKEAVEVNLILLLQFLYGIWPDCSDIHFGHFNALQPIRNNSKCPFKRSKFQFELSLLHGAKSNPWKIWTNIDQIKPRAYHRSYYRHHHITSNCV